MGVMFPRQNKRLILCLHDVSPRDFDRVREIDRFFHEIGIGANYAMLVIPDFEGRWRIEHHPDFLSWLKERAQAGVEMILHGFFHKDTTPSERRTWRTRLGHAVCGEGEFGAISELEAQKRLQKGRLILEDILDRRIDSFVAPAWQYSRGARTALAKLGFKLAENRMTVWSPARGEVLAKSPVIAYASRNVVRENASIAWSRLSTRAMHSCDVVRHALHPADFNSSRLVEEIRRSLRNLMLDRRIVRYEHLLHTPAA